MDICMTNLIRVYTIKYIKGDILFDNKNTNTTVDRSVTFNSFILKLKTEVALRIGLASRIW